jgi:hypothetical protein
MTMKMRHDRPNVKHNQINAVAEISKMWKNMTDDERTYYNNFSKEAREVYKKQYREFRATGVYTKSGKYEKLGNAWVHVLDEEKNALEKELASYPTVVLPTASDIEHPDKYTESGEIRDDDEVDEGSGLRSHHIHHV